MNPPHSHSLHHWSYTPNGAVSTWAPATAALPSRPSKRPHSESDDCDDVFSEDSKEQCTSPGDADSCQMLSRKKRRGVIEKKRRDRINTSLSELKRLVPSAYEKQGSAKLEKAEILQLTVDHLKMIHAKGLDALAYDPHKFAMDYHNIGFRECATEVARYLVTIEGMDIQDPLRLRLMSHLQCFAAQRELASKQAASVSPWGYGGTSTQNYTPPLNPIPASPSAPVSSHTIPGNLGSISNHLSHQPPPPSLLHQSNVHDLNAHFDISTSCAQPTVVPASSDAARQSLSQSSSSTVLTPLTTATTTTASTAFGYPHHQYPNLNSFASSPNNGHHPNYNQANSGAQMKPYRPWGAEVAY